MNNNTASQDWDLIIEPKRSLLALNLKEVWKYKDLLLLFVKRDITTVYKQTVLGPLWFFIQPILTSITYVIVFSKIAHLSTAGMPQILFYLSGVSLWTYFTTCLSSSSTTFTSNAAIFGKVYFPRLVSPLSVVASNVIKFAIQLLPLILCYIYFVLDGAEIRPNVTFLLFPILLLIAGLLGMAIGLIVSALTTKYRDLSFVVNVLMQVLMYASTVLYPQEVITNEFIKTLVQLNPMTWIIDAFRFSVFGVGEMAWGGILYSVIVTMITLLGGIIIFNQVEKTFVDTV